MVNEPSNPGTPPPLPQSTGVPVSAASKPVTTVTAGTLIMGTYEIEKLINSGGMGEVYRGRNIHNGEPVAIKIVLPALAHDPKIVALFQKESTTLSRLSHEAIVRYHVFTVDPTIGRPCMVMEFVSGTAMSDRIEQGPMPADEVRTMLRRVASGLDKAHRAGVVHRDLSPDNVILEDGNVEHAKLIDFGIAKSTAMGAGTLLQGQFAGKFNWVAPEQLGAFGGHVDGRSDIYSLALVTAAASKGEVLPMGASIVDAVGKRSSVPDLAGVDPSLVALLSWMLQPDPALRPESMAKVMAAVDNPEVIPVAASAEPKAVDPNRTVIGGALPPFDLSAAEAAKSLPPVAPKSLPPLAAPVQTPAPVAGWDMPGGQSQTTPPQGATVISSAPPMAMPPMPEEEPEDFSPFGAPGAAAKPQAAVAPPLATSAAKKGKGGMVAVLALLAAGAGGAGAYYGGVFDPKPAVVTDETPAVPDPAADKVKAAEAAKATEAEAAQKASDEAAAAKTAEQVAAQKAADEAAAKAAADAKAAEEATKKAEAEAAAKSAEADAAKAAEAAAAQKAAEDAASAKAAEEAAAAKTAADAKAAEDAAKLAAAEAAKSDDPVARQTAFMAAMTPAACSYVSLADPKPEGFSLHGFAADTKPLEDMAAAWKKETGLTPDVQVHLINNEQCALLDFINRHPTAVDVKPISVTMDPSIGEVVKSGGVVKGSIAGLGAGSLTLLNVSGTGGISNLNKFISTTADGTIGFSIVLKLAEGAPPAPQLFLAMESEEKLQALLAAVDAGVSAKALMPFIDLALKKDPAPVKLGLAFIRLEN